MAQFAPHVVIADETKTREFTAIGEQRKEKKMKELKI